MVELTQIVVELTAAARESARIEAGPSSSSTPPNMGMREEVERLRAALSRAEEVRDDAQTEVEEL